MFLRTKITYLEIELFLPDFLRHNVDKNRAITVCRPTADEGGISTKSASGS